MSDPAFRDEVVRAIEVYEKVIGHQATRTWPMIERYGIIGALSRLVVSPDLQKGFKALRDSHQLEYSFEAIVVRHKDDFESEVVEAAQWRLDHADELL